MRARRAALGAGARLRARACPAAAPSPDRLTEALAARAPRMATHHDAVAELAGRVARGIGLGENDLHLVVRAAELHDVGKVAVPDTILNKPGSLAADELEVMRRHTVVGEAIIAGSAEPAPVAAIVRSSHERWDGSGYPDGLCGEDIPLGARIITICDAYDAMTHARPYRAARPAPDALDELRRGAGRRYDPRLVAVFLAAVDAGGRPGAAPPAP
jgi:putative nucleotidyltransferase with HDIG domain